MFTGRRWAYVRGTLKDRRALHHARACDEVGHGTEAVPQTRGPRQTGRKANTSEGREVS
jgi:hypothetical protein